ncbi:MAG: citramalate synthase [Chloroflexi bacterium]|jgi:2-isopropylmalate synthase|nr:citramalate synthase [Anaerolineaceae bacterium]NMB87944.1 citramalate synthase [Chloroflexota bacterium]
MIQIYDTTLRDGTQRTDISLSLNDKINIARRLDALGIRFIEGGWPGSNPKDVEFFQRAAQMEWKTASIVAFGATCQADKHPSEDANIRALQNAGTDWCAVFGKSSVLHVTEVLRTTCENNLRMIEESVAYLVQNGQRVIYDAEHFFDGYKEDPQYALQTLKAAVRGGAENLTLCDTNGGTMPWEVSEIVRAVRAEVDIPLGIHTHNDAECAVANTLAAVREGCTLVQGTINGYGERCGNANLCSIIPDLQLKMGQEALDPEQLANLFDLSHYVAEVANLSPDEHLAYVGRAAFAHKGGVHVAAMRRNVHSYQHVEPELVGNQSEVVVSELSGRGNLLSKIEEYGMDQPPAEVVSAVLQTIKQLESQGFSFEAADASVVLMLKRQEPGYQPPFELIDFASQVEHRQGRGIFAEATVKVRVDDEIVHTAAEGNGPVNALDKALRKALVSRYPEVELFSLSDYKVRILDGNQGTNATTRVLIDNQNGSKRWSAVGASTNIIEASWQALVDSIEYGLMVTCQEPALAH